MTLQEILEQVPDMATYLQDAEEGRLKWFCYGNSQTLYSQMKGEVFSAAVKLSHGDEVKHSEYFGVLMEEVQRIVKSCEQKGMIRGE